MRNLIQPRRRQLASLPEEQLPPKSQPATRHGAWGDAGAMGDAESNKARLSCFRACGKQPPHPNPPPLLCFLSSSAWVGASFSHRQREEREGKGACQGCSAASSVYYKYWAQSENTIMKSSHQELCIQVGGRNEPEASLGLGGSRQLGTGGAGKLPPGQEHALPQHYHRRYPWCPTATVSLHRPRSTVATTAESCRDHAEPKH